MLSRVSYLKLGGKRHLIWRQAQAQDAIERDVMGTSGGLSDVCGVLWGQAVHLERPAGAAAPSAKLRHPGQLHSPLPARLF